MAGKEGKLSDPVAEGDKEKDAASLEAEASALSIESLSLEDFQPIPARAARQAHPFEGYPMRKITIGSYNGGPKGKEIPLMVNATFIVALNPKEYVPQDPSGKGVSIMAKGAEKIVDLATHHNRIVVSETGQNLNIVFDREIHLADGKHLGRVGICPDHTARAQIVFKVNPKTGRTEVDARYMLADAGQIGRLRRCFDMFHYQQTQSERLAQRFDAEPESKAQP